MTATISVVDDAEIEFVVVDDDGDEVNVSIEWFKNGVSLLNASSGFLANGTSSSFTLTSGNYSLGDNLTANLTPTDNQSGVGLTYNVSVKTVVGSPINGVTDLGVVSYYKNWVYINWTNPVSDYATTEGRVNGSLVFNSSVSSYNFTGLTRDTSYLFSFYTWSTSGVRNNTAVSVVQATAPNVAPSIDSYEPTDLSPVVEENSSTLFNATATDDDVVVWYRWLLDGVVQAVSQAWSFVTGLSDSGSYNVTLIVNDSYNDTASVEWAVTVLNTSSIKEIITINTKIRNSTNHRKQ